LWLLIKGSKSDLIAWLKLFYMSVQFATESRESIATTLVS